MEIPAKPAEAAASNRSENVTRRGNVPEHRIKSPARSTTGTAWRDSSNPSDGSRRCSEGVGERDDALRDRVGRPAGQVVADPLDQLEAGVRERGAQLARGTDGNDLVARVGEHQRR